MPRTKKQAEVEKKENNSMLWVGVVIVVIGLAWYVLASMSGWQEGMMHNWWNGRSDYSDESTVASEAAGYYGVYMTTGDLYFGEIKEGDENVLRKAYVMRLTQDENNPVRVEKFSDSIWGPEGDIYLNKDNVVWRAKVSSQSQLMSIISK